MGHARQDDYRRVPASSGIIEHPKLGYTLEKAARVETDVSVALKLGNESSLEYLQRTSLTIPDWAHLPSSEWHISLSQRLLVPSFRRPDLETL